MGTPRIHHIKPFVQFRQYGVNIPLTTIKTAAIILAGSVEMPSTSVPYTSFFVRPYRRKYRYQRGVQKVSPPPDITPSDLILWGYVNYVYITSVDDITNLPERIINPLNAELNTICYLLALLAHHFLHVSRIRVKSLTLRLLMSYIYMEHQFLMFLDHTQRRTTVGRIPLDE